MENLQKLKLLAHRCNECYNSGLNDDDQVKAMFDFSKSIIDAFIVVGYDSYGAISLEQLKESYLMNGVSYNGQGMAKIRFSNSECVGDVWITEAFFKKEIINDKQPLNV